MAISLCGMRLLLTRSNLFANSRRHGYIVLVPEIGEDLPEKNPLSSLHGLPEFNNVTIEKCVGAIGQQAIAVEKSVRNLEERLAQAEDVDGVVKNIILPLEGKSAPLETTWGIAKTLFLGNSSRMPTKSYMTIHERARGARRAKFNSIPIYRALKAALEVPTELGAGEQQHTAMDSELTGEERRLLQKYVLEAKLSGIEVEGSAKLELNEILDRLAKERSQFQNKRDVAVKKFKQTIQDPAIMKEFPPTLLQSLAADPSQAMKGPWQITLQPAVAHSFLEYCSDRTHRWNLWQADTRKCSIHTDKSLENSSHLESIRSLRKRQAKLLGYESYVHMSMETKMAGSIEAVRNVLDELLRYARPAADNELAVLERFANEHGFRSTLDIYDVPYWKRRHLADVHQFDQEALKDYFPLPKVIGGLFQLAEQLFGVRIEERLGVDVWHEDVRFYDIFEAGGSKEPIAGFYTDFYSREDEKVAVPDNTGWMVGIVNRSVALDARPLAALICNFPAPLYGKPSLLTLNDVQMLFKQFGRGLQHLLTTCQYSDVAGLSNIEWDAVEVCGHVFTHFLYDGATIRSISSHYTNEDPLPEPCVEAIQRRRTHLAGYRLCRELYLANLDLQLHLSSDYWLDVMRALYPCYHQFPLDRKDAHPCSLIEVVSGDWGAAYYGHVWSRMIAADVYSAFAEAKEPAARQEVGRRFRDTFLSLGGGCHPSEIFRRFRGRDPSPTALLQTLGIFKHQHGSATPAGTTVSHSNPVQSSNKV
uniref:Peptidase M3A/M3B catalytic domain-containing protein n=1 Tax=Anopheles atroparvus TaxID=41427 RepID=A0AAG5DWL3_ANOAO